jgi:hypothetical protein
MLRADIFLAAAARPGADKPRQSMEERIAAAATTAGLSIGWWQIPKFRGGTLLTKSEPRHPTLSGQIFSGLAALLKHRRSAPRRPCVRAGRR